MTHWIATILAIGAMLFLPNGNALSDNVQTGPVELAEYTDRRSGHHFELFQEPDGSFVCSVERPDGSISGFDICTPEAEQTPCTPNLQTIAKLYCQTECRNTSRQGARRPPEPLSLLLLLMVSEEGPS